MKNTEYYSVKMWHTETSSDALILNIISHLNSHYFQTEMSHDGRSKRTDPGERWFTS
jgi:hypothetical protein